MGVTRTELFTENQNQIADILKALGHPARIAIIEFLIQEKTCVCGDLVLKLPLAQAMISQHLKELKEANIIQGTIEGTSVCYCLNLEIFKKIEKYIRVFTKTETGWCC